jgi:hypothetical protein
LAGLPQQFVANAAGRKKVSLFAHVRRIRG